MEKKSEKNLFSTFGVTGNKWRLAAKATCTTMSASFGGGFVAIVMSYISNGGKIEVLPTINGILGSLTGISAGIIFKNFFFIKLKVIFKLYKPIFCL